MSSYWWQPFVPSIVKWWLCVFFLGWVSYPLIFRCFILLPDRGIGLSKLLGIMIPVFGYAVIALRWDLSDPVGQNGLPVGLLWAIGFWVALNLILLRRSWRPIFQFLALRWRMVVLYECAFLASFLLYLWFRSYVPDATFDALGWYGAEKWDNLAILTSIWRNPTIPPTDPWLSGHSLNYYYFSHLIWAMLARLSGVAPQVAFNLALGTLFALLVAVSFSTGHAVSERKQGGLWAVLLIVLTGSLATWDQWKSMIAGFGRDGISGFFGSFSFWTPSDVLPNTRNEFPAFNWLLGDLHAHGTGLLFLLSAICLLVQVQRMREVESPTWIKTPAVQPMTWLVLLVVFAVMWSTNSWDLLVVALLGFFWILAESMREQSAGLRLSQFVQGLLIWAITGVVGVSILASFYSRYTYPPLEILNPALAALPGPLGMLGSIGVVDFFRRTTPEQWLSFWGFFLFGAGAIWCLSLLREADVLGNRIRAFAATAKSGWNSPLLALVALSLAAIVFAYQFLGRLPWVALSLAIAIGLCMHFLLQMRTYGPRRWALLLALVALTLQIIPEFIYVDDPIANDPFQRYNTVFKLYYPAWALLALALSVFLADLKVISFSAVGSSNIESIQDEITAANIEPPAEMLAESPQKHFLFSKGRLVRANFSPKTVYCINQTATWAILIILLIMLIIGAGAYTFFGVGQRIQNSRERMQNLADMGWSGDRIRKACRTIDGLAFLPLPKYGAEDDLRLGLWMRENLNAAEQIVETSGPSYSMTARFSVISGIPSYMGWTGHETQWRGANRFNPIFMRRNAVLEVIYRSSNAEEALRVCRQNGLRYVAVGSLERLKYPRERLAKLDKIGKIRKRFGQSVLYEINFKQDHIIKSPLQNLPKK